MTRYEWRVAVMAHFGLAGAGATVVALALTEHGEQDLSDVRPGHARLATMLGTTERAIRRNLSALRDAGFLSWTQRGRGPCAYTFAFPDGRTPASGRTLEAGRTESSGRTLAALRPDASVRLDRTPASADSVLLTPDLTPSSGSGSNPPGTEPVPATVPVPPAAPSPHPKRPPSSDGQRLVEAFAVRFREETGADLTTDKADFVIAARLLKQEGGLAPLLARFDAFFADQWRREHGRLTFRVFSATDVQNSLKAEGARPAPAGKGGYDPARWKRVRQPDGHDKLVYLGDGPREQKP